MEEIKHRSDPQPNLGGLSEFDEIRPYEPEEMKQAFEDLLNDRQFNVIMKGFAPWLPKGVRNGLLRLAFVGVKTPLDFQLRFMKPVVKHIIRKYTDGCTFDDRLLTENLELRTERYDNSQGQNSCAKGNHTSQSSTLSSQLEERYTFVSNHRDIVLDSAFLDVKLVENGYPTTVEIGIGDNLLIYPWIKRLVRMNKAFTVRRGLSLRETLAASQLMSRYIHFAVTQKKENIWIAQREGRAGYKGRVVYRTAAPINTWIDDFSHLPKTEYYKAVAERMDKEIHRGYELFPCNWLALDELNGDHANASHYTEADRQRFEQYLSAQLDKIQIPDKDIPFLRERILTMYANPARNKVYSL